MQNYHNHKYFSNLNTPFKDSHIGYEDYAKRIVDLNQSIITSVEHGWQGNYMKCWNVAKEYGLQFVYGTEAYWVADRKESDRTNAHMILLAQNKDGMFQINRMLSEANRSGFYAVPRIDLELMKMLNPDDVLATTACVAFWGKPDKETGHVKWHYGGEENERTKVLDLFNQIYDYFGSSLMLEVQCHNTEWQKEINRLILDLHYKNNIPLIAGMDSHYIFPEQKDERQLLREDAKIKMSDFDHEFNDEVYEDYPDEETFINRFRTQGVLTESEIAEAIQNTDVVTMFDDIDFDKSRKLPSIFQNLTQEKRNEKYLSIVTDAWDEYKTNVPQSRWSEYWDSFYENEVKIVLDTNMSDYFLLDHELVKLGKKKGGMITPTGRGSAGSWFSNTLLGLSTLDRFDLPVPMYPSRFCTADRLRTSAPDIDMNLDDQDIFAEAQEELLGKNHSYPMISYGTLKYKSAFKLYAKIKGVPFDEANEVAKQINQYEMALREAEDEEEKELIDINDFVDKKYHKHIEGSAPYRNIVVSKSKAPCGYLIYNGDIESEIGIMRVTANNGKKTFFCTVIDGYTAEEFGYMKNDLLVVNVISVNAEAMRRAGLPQYTSKQIIELTKDDPATWDIFAKGYTQGINQCQGAATTNKVMQYKPKSLQDLTAFVAAIRPGFKSMLSRFLGREKFSYGIPSFDALLKNDSSGSSWLLYQEDIMKCLSLAKFPAEEQYPVIKAISKKKVKVIASAKDRFLTNFAEYVIENEGKSDDEAKEAADKVWQVIIDSASYSFNSAHAVAVAIDALYGAYLKAHYPLAYYSTLLDINASNAKKCFKIADEMKAAFKILRIAPMFGQDNRKCYIDTEHNSISSPLSSYKNLSATLAQALYEKRNCQYDNFIDLLIDFTSVRATNNEKVIKILILLGYFSKFGEKDKLLYLYKEFKDGKNKYTKSVIPSTLEKRVKYLHDLESGSEYVRIKPIDSIKMEMELIGVPVTIDPQMRGAYVCVDLNSQYTPRAKLYSVATGNYGTVRILKSDYKAQPFEIGGIINVENHTRRAPVSYSNGERHVLRDVPKEIWITKYSIL